MIIDFDHDLSIVISECHVVEGLDVDGNEVYAVMWRQNGEDNLPNIIRALGMLEAAKLDLLQQLGLMGDE